MLYHRTEGVHPGTLDEFSRRRLYPCNGCLQTARRRNGSPVHTRRVYACRTSDSLPLGTAACSRCRFIVLVDGAFGLPIDFMREMCRREAEADSRGPDIETDAGTFVPARGGFIMRHSDTKTSFGTGAQRDTDEGKGRPSLISPVLIHRLGVHLARGAKHYGDDNWAKGMPYRRTADSMIRHIFQWLAGDQEEDHLGAIAFGVMCLMTYESNKILDQKLDDRDENLKKILASILTSPSKDATLKVSSVHESVDDFVESETQPSSMLCNMCCGNSTTRPTGICIWCSIQMMSEEEFNAA